ncbi:MAG: GC-type dockerin domain-anchored protein [Planctomycetota bacterium]
MRRQTPFVPKLVALRGLALSTCAMAQTAPPPPVPVVSGNGSSLFSELFADPQFTVDFIDFDMDGQSLTTNGEPDQLVRSPQPDNGNALFFSQRFMNPRSALIEFDRFAGIFDFSPDNVDENQMNGPSDDPGNSAFVDSAIFSRGTVVIFNDPSSLLNPNHRGGLPFLPRADGTYLSALRDNNNAGFTLDYAFLSSPVSWLTAVPGEVSSPLSVPGRPGYGGGARPIRDRQGRPVPIFDGRDAGGLAQLRRLNTLTTRPDQETIFEFPIVAEPLAPIVSFGAGLEEIDASDLRHLLITGRRLNGENLLAVTGRPGLAAANAVGNSIGFDPSWGTGEAVGLSNTGNFSSRLGVGFEPSTKRSLSLIERGVRNHRLAVGYSSPRRIVEAGDLGTRLEILGVRNDLRGGRSFVRPTLENILEGGPEGHAINAIGVVAVLGDPRALPPQLGGFGFDPKNESGANPFENNPFPPNIAAGGFVNNARRSLEAFAADPFSNTAPQSPAFAVASRFFLPGVFSRLTAATDPRVDQQPLPFENVNGRGGDLEQFTSFAQEIFLTSRLAQFEQQTAGAVPERSSSFGNPDGPYSDANAPGGSQFGTFYVDQRGNQLSPGTQLSFRNKVAGDFNNDGLRDVGDTFDMLLAFLDRSDGPTWRDDNGVGFGVIEILGDFDGDGSFDAEDVRYFADGLVLERNGLDISPVTGIDRENDGVIDGFQIGDGIADRTLDRRLGFEMIDLTWGEIVGDRNFFGTVLANPNEPYEPGDSRFDVAGSGRSAAGYAPVGADGVVDAIDIDAIRDSFKDWTDLRRLAGTSPATNEPLVIGLVGPSMSIGDQPLGASGQMEGGGEGNYEISPDTNGDLIIDEDDVDDLLDALGTKRGDVNLDGLLDGTDQAIIEANMSAAFSGAPSYGDGDVDLDQDVDADDLLYFKRAQCLADYDGNGVLNITDLFQYIDAFTMSPPAASTDMDGNGIINITDLFAYIDLFTCGCIN